jgi:uncharacterized membrane protein YfcA
MSGLEIVLLALAGFAGGVANAVAGGGTFFSFPIMVAFGMTTLDANATTAVGFVPGSLATTAAYWPETRHRIREILPFALVGIAGGVIGGLLVIGIGDAGFRPTVPWLLAGATLVFAFSGRIKTFTARFTQKGARHAKMAAYVLMSLAAIYGGFFGAGLGIMVLATLAVIEDGDFHRANATKNILCVLAQAMAVALFIWNGLVHWPQALITIAGAILGGYYGIVVARRVPEHIVRAVVVAIGAVLSAVFFLRG